MVKSHGVELPGQSFSGIAGPPSLITRSTGQAVHVMPVNTDMVPDSGPTVASRTTVMSGNAVLDAARQLDGGGEAGTPAAMVAAMAKVFASEAAIHCSMEAMRVLGGYGFTIDFPVERYYRDAPLMAIGEGTNEILQLLVADSLLREIGQSA